MGFLPAKRAEAVFQEVFKHGTLRSYVMLALR